MYFWETDMPEYSPPEMQRCPIDNLILQVHSLLQLSLSVQTDLDWPFPCAQVKILGMGSPRSFLEQALQPPNVSAIDDTITNLKNCGVLASLSARAPISLS
jgi:HrpA-like RNA helicase